MSLKFQSFSTAIHLSFPCSHPDSMAANLYGKHNLSRDQRGEARVNDKW
jgi:hypothetical protein